MPQQPQERAVHGPAGEEAGQGWHTRRGIGVHTACGQPGWVYQLMPWLSLPAHSRPLSEERGTWAPGKGLL